MLCFPDWSDEENEAVGAHRLRILSVSDANLDTARALTVEAVPNHYASPEHLARAFEKLQKPAIAKLLRAKLPNDKTKRSGDLGEIFATEYVNEETAYTAPIKRLRWKDHREMAMRGDDVIGICLPDDGGKILFLKVEAKSEAALRTRTVKKAREALDGDQELPSSHALAFISERLLELGQEELADAIDNALLVQGITAAQVAHMLFVFSGNAPARFLKTDLENYGGSIGQLSVGLRIEQHQEFIASVYNEVLGADER